MNSFTVTLTNAGFEILRWVYLACLHPVVASIVATIIFTGLMTAFTPSRRTFV